MVTAAASEPQWGVDHYKYMDYHEMRAKLHKLARQYPRLMKLEDSESAYGIRHEEMCGNER